jgi:hypothetical protein
MIVHNSKKDTPMATAGSCNCFTKSLSSNMGLTLAQAVSAIVGLLLTLIAAARGRKVRLAYS